MTRARLLPYVLIAPATIFLIALFVVPLVQTIALRLHRQRRGLSLTNFRKMVDDLNFGFPSATPSCSCLRSFRCSSVSRSSWR